MVVHSGNGTRAQEIRACYYIPAAPSAGIYHSTARQIKKIYSKLIAVHIRIDPRGSQKIRAPRIALPWER